MPGLESDLNSSGSVLEYVLWRRCFWEDSMAFALAFALKTGGYKHYSMLDITASVGVWERGSEALTWCWSWAHRLFDINRGLHNMRKQ